MDLNDVRLFQYLKNEDSKLAEQVESVYNITKDTIDGISGCYNNFTMHNTGHSLRVANYMGELACGVDEEYEKNITQYNAFEVALMLLSAILHDIGMFIRPEDRERIRRNDIPYTNSLTFSGAMAVTGDDEEAIKEIVRITHAHRIKEYIDYVFADKTISSILRLEDKYGYADDITEICIGHGEDYDYLKKLRSQCMKGTYAYNLQYIAVLLRVADYLDLDSQRTPVLWYTMMRIDGFSKSEWEKHFIVHNERKLKRYIGDKLQIFFEGKSSNAKIHRKYLAYVDSIRDELEKADALLNRKDVEEKYLFRITPKVDDCVVTEGFKYSDLRLSLDYSSITDLLMGTNIYGEKKLGLRELIQNAIDACELMKEIQGKSDEYDALTPQIAILISQKNNYVKIKDTGIGMTLDTVKKHFLNVGKSYYSSNEFKYESHKYRPIGQFGIGFLACFLLSSSVSVKTKHYKSHEINHIELEKHSEYVVTNTEETGNFLGTEIMLNYNEFFKVFHSTNELIDFVEKYFCTSIPITVRDVDARNDLAKSKSDTSEFMVLLDRDTKNTKFCDVNCSDYSDIMDGTIRVRDTQRTTNFDVKTLEDKNIYILNSMNKKIEAVEDVTNVPTGFYRMLEYALIDEKMYSTIKSTRKTAKGKRKAILSGTNHIFFLLPEDTRISYDTVENDIRITVNGIKLEELIKENNLPYYDEVVDEFEYYIPVFVRNKRYIELQSSGLYGEYYIMDDRETLIFFNKGIWVKDMYPVSCELPAAVKMMAVLNYKKQGVKLDVSRNRLLDGKDLVRNELTKIMLKYLLGKKENADISMMITSMIEYIDNRDIS